MKRLWCKLFHNYIRLPDLKWKNLVCQKCGLKYPIEYSTYGKRTS